MCHTVICIGVLPTLHTQRAGEADWTTQSQATFSRKFTALRIGPSAPNSGDPSRTSNKTTAKRFPDCTPKRCSSFYFRLKRLQQFIKSNTKQTAPSRTGAEIEHDDSLGVCCKRVYEVKGASRFADLPQISAYYEYARSCVPPARFCFAAVSTFIG